MPQLRWNETDFLDFFSVVPTIDEHTTSCSYEVQRDGLRLLLTLWHWESVIQASLFREKSETALITFAAYVRGEARFVNDKRGRYLDFEDSLVAPSRFWYMEAGDPFDRTRFSIAVNIRLAIDPDIRIDFTNYESRT
jgi:hypothetical protein